MEKRYFKQLLRICSLFWIYCNFLKYEFILNNNCWYYLISISIYLSLLKLKENCILFCLIFIFLWKNNWRLKYFKQLANSKNTSLKQKKVVVFRIKIHLDFSQRGLLYRPKFLCKKNRKKKLKRKKKLSYFVKKNSKLKC